MANISVAPQGQQLMAQVSKAGSAAGSKIISGVVFLGAGAILLLWFYFSVASSVLSYGAYQYQAKLAAKNSTGVSQGLTLGAILEHQQRLQEVNSACFNVRIERRQLERYPLAAQAQNQVPNLDLEQRRKAARDQEMEVCVTERAKITDEIKKAGTSELIRELYSFDAVPLWPFVTDDFPASNYAKFPSSVLTLILALAMGALGSTIFVTGWFLKELAVTTKSGADDSQSRGLRLSILGWVIFRPVLGMVTAVGVFVAYKTGQITLSGSTVNTSEIELNPFLLAFFAIIAGLASENAIAKLTEIADSAFKSSEPSANNGNGLVKTVEDPAASETAHNARAILKASGRTIEEVCADLGMSGDTARVEKWIDGSEPIPAPMLSAFATALRTTPDKLKG